MFGKKYLFARFAIFASGFGLVCLGCSNASNDKATRIEVIKADPSFAKLIEKRDDLASKVSQLQRELSLKQTQIEKQIDQLKQDLREARSQVNSKIQQTKALLDPERQNLELSLSLAENELKSKRAQRAALSRSIERLKKAIKESASLWSKDQKEKTQADLNDFIHEAKRLDVELSSLKAHDKLLKQKLALLKL